jgi:protease I
MLKSELKIVFLVASEFEDLEFWVPYMRLKEDGFSLVIAGPNANETYRGKIGIPATAEISFKEMQADQFQAVVIPGGWAPDKIRRYPEVAQFLQKMNSQHKIIAMICHAGLVGISAGIVKGHFATGSEGIKDDLINAGAAWKNEPAFRSENLVWGRVVADIPDFCRELIQALKSLP